MKLKMAFEKINLVKDYLLHLQNYLCESLQKEEGSSHFLEDKWNHTSGGGGITRILESGDNIDKAGVNFSHIFGNELPIAATIKRKELAQAPFQALGVSAVFHPVNPYVPTTHFNVRFIAVEKPDQIIWWFGGGFDLTPYYGFEEDCRDWHKKAKEACDSLGSHIYSQFKKNCDQYFFLPHRQEPRGIGGIFFDDLNELGFDACFNFIKNVGNCFAKAYFPILKKRKNFPFSQREKNFQAYRRGRYVEFNLLYDRGTLFGLQSGGRTESILMSLPPQVAWRYNYQPAKDSPEEDLYKNFLIIKEWL